MTTMIILIVFALHLLFVVFELMAYSVDIKPANNQENHQEPGALPHPHPLPQARPNPGRSVGATQRRGLMAGPAWTLPVQ